MTIKMMAMMAPMPMYMGALLPSSPVLFPLIGESVTPPSAGAPAARGGRR
jgi:hypothetical protein